MHGIDLNEAFIQQAKKAARGKKLDITWHQQDMRRLPWKQRFDAAICMWSSFGYFTEQENAAFIAAISRSLKKGGRFLLDFQVTETLTRILFPFLILVGLWAYAMGILNSLGYFAVPAYGPCVLNLAMILCASFFGENVMGLASGVLVGGVLQLLIQLPPLYKSGWRLRLTAGF